MEIILELNLIFWLRKILKCFLQRNAMLSGM